ncbi:uncharacterized protein LOC132266730 isoform X2 [Cornus florida]|uniref:uncharacterized protein LOC132266730 isoform X2 n=1 Tax=Cornus florida TaxID=4283 RepID=UPI00289C30A0|nr:uncharacterized protein LOC132266730 isoform X2 [Cornus florida]
MRDDDVLPISTQTTTSSSSSSTISKKETSDSNLLFGRGRYKFWALAAILLLAFWSMLTGTVTLRWSGNLNNFSDHFDTPFHDDLDVLEMEEREKLVKHMWDVYTNSRRIRLPRFWREAFEAAYEDLTSDDSGVREAAISEIAKMSIRSIDIEPPPLQSTSVGEFNMMQSEKGKMAVT